MKFHRSFPLAALWADRPRARKLICRSAVRAVEQLEGRTLLSVALNSAGWTQVTPSADSRLIYVSSSTGSDANSGLSANYPVATIAKAYTLLRNDEPDWILFKRGDTFDGNFNYFGDSGQDAQDPMVVTYYGDPTLPRPVIDSGAATAFRTGTANHDLYVIGLNFTTSTHDPSSPNYNGQGSYGFYDLGGTSDLLIEDCSFSYFINDITFQGYNGPLSNIDIRRNEILDSYNAHGHSEGMYAESVTNLTIEDNVFDQDGWNTLVPGAGPTIYNHDCYLHSSNVNCVVTGNTFADAASFGLEARAGGIVDDNLFVNDPYGFAFGLVNGSTVTAGGVSGEAVGNVVIEPRQDGNGWGIGALIGNLSPDGTTVIADNIFADAPGDTAPALQFAPGHAVSNPRDEVGLHSLMVTNNTSYGWGFGISMSSSYVAGGTGAESLSDIVIQDNNFQDSDTDRAVSHGNAFDPAEETWTDNSYSSSDNAATWFSLGSAHVSFSTWQSSVEPTAISQPVSFVDATRTVETYMMALGDAGGMADYDADIRNLSATNWDPAYSASTINSYVQAGFTPGTPDPTIGVPRTRQIPTQISLLGPKQTVVTPPASASDALVLANLIPPLVAAPTPAAPVLSRVALKYGDAQHTIVNSISLVFSQPVTASSTMASLVANTAAGTTNVTTLVSNPSGDGKNWLVTFLTAPLGSGAYTLTVNGSAIANASGEAVGGNNLTTTFTVSQAAVQASRVAKHTANPKPKKVAHPKRAIVHPHHVKVKISG